MNLDREGGRNTEGSLDDAITSILRLAGFAKKFLGVPYDLSFLGNGIIIAKFMKFLSERPNRDVKNNSYVEVMLRHFRKLMKFLAKEQPLRAGGLLELAAKIGECRAQLHTVSIVTPLNTNDLIEKGEAVSYEQLAVYGVNFVGAYVNISLASLIGLSRTLVYLVIARTCIFAPTTCMCV